MDGFPKNAAQVKLLASLNVLPHKLVVVDCPESVVLERQIHRRRDRKTGRVYDLKTNPPPDTVNEKDLVVRESDKPENVSAKYQKWKAEVDAMEAAFGKRVIHVNGEKEPEPLFQEMLDKIYNTTRPWFGQKYTPK